MALEKDLERGEREPLIENKKEENSIGNGSERSIKMVIFSTLVAVCGSFEFGACFSIFGSIMTIGAMLGAVSSGNVSDLIGRKGAMRASAIFCIMGWLAIYFAKNVLFLDTGRFSLGIGIGVLSYVVPVFIAEIAPKNLRGGLTSMNQLMICSGMTITFIVGTFVSWRTLVLTGLLPCVVLLVGLNFIPESPRWLAKLGYHEEFEDALRKLHGKDADISEEAAEIQVGVGLMVLQNFGGYNGISYYASETVVSAGFSSGNFGTILMGSIQVPITALGAILMDKCGRRPLLIVSALGTFLGCFLAAISFYLKGQGLYMEWSPMLALFGILIYLGFYSIGMGPIPWVLMSEIFPINMKGIAGSLVVFANWFCSWVLCYAFNFLMSWSSSGTFLIFSAVCASTILFVGKLVPETKGRTLEEIQASMNSCK
ncbi:uncharacterized protein A4U43_C08F30850 [Asparagus officinalis]|nr:uncharacterized protein A4U43_C08F30850 [Asparagus officinalis]